ASGRGARELPGGRAPPPRGPWSSWGVRAAYQTSASAAPPGPPCADRAGALRRRRRRAPELPAPPSACVGLGSASGVAPPAPPRGLVHPVSAHGPQAPTDVDPPPLAGRPARRRRRAHAAQARAAASLSAAARYSADRARPPVQAEDAPP